MTVLIISCHPDDMEIMMGGTALRLRDAGCTVHHLIVANGSAGSTEAGPEEIARVRRDESLAASKLLGSVLHESLVEDLEVFYTQDVIRRVTALVRQVRPGIVLTQSLEDYMEDHANTARLAVTGTFVRSIRNYRSVPEAEPVFDDVMLYHATPHILTDQMRRPIVPEIYVDAGDVMERKERLLACHASQKAWLDRTQGFGSYLATMRDLTRKVGEMSGHFAFAEGWRRHSHVGFSRADGDPLSEVLGKRCWSPLSP